MRRCLIIDDSDVIRKVARHILEKMNYEVSEAENGPDGLEICQAAMPELIILDWHMPTMSGHEFLIKLKNIPRKHWPVIIYCTSENDSTDISLAINEGAADYLLKPFDGHTLLTLVAQLTEETV